MIMANSIRLDPKEFSFMTQIVLENVHVMQVVGDVKKLFNMSVNADFGARTNLRPLTIIHSNGNHPVKLS